MLAREIMIPEPFVAAAGATSAEVALLMRAKDISVVPVVDNPQGRRYLGTLSDRDIVTRCVAAGHDPTNFPPPLPPPTRPSLSPTPHIVDPRRSRPHASAREENRRRARDPPSPVARPGGDVRAGGGGCASGMGRVDRAGGAARPHRRGGGAD